MSDWHDIKEELPNINSQVFVSVFDAVTQQSYPHTAIFLKDKRFHSNQTGEIFENVTHWSYFKEPIVNFKPNRLMKAKNEVIDESKITRESLNQVLININNIIPNLNEVCHSLIEVSRIINELLIIK
jgi:hypothetical protein